MTNPPDRELAVFSAVRRLPTRERSAFLDETCAGDVALRQRVEDLLRAYEQAENFLRASPAGVDSKRTIHIEIPITEKPGDKIGRYKLLQQIGEGGCGVVYMAEQEEPVRRRVALKVIKLGMDTKSVIARFEAERQALALMDHPNIAKVLDAGSTDMGRPYFVMELVRGIKITEFCDENKVSTEGRLKLFIQVCQAIQHAHQKGIIHRDIKPSNILVTVNDGMPVPKVIDFGIAKATQGRLTDKTLFTAFEQFIGTPAYMSPEQAVMTSLDVDTRSDIYSLGVLLYELLTGKTPFDANELLQSGLDAMRRTIREKEPQKPSTCLSTMLDVERTTAAKYRQTESPKLIHLVRGDLDWIVMKSLEKDRARRYETANGLAMDVQRHLNNEPVTASPPSNLYKFRKLVGRNKLAFLAANAVTAALFIGLGVSTWMFFQEQQARQQAQEEAAKANAISDFLQRSLQSANPDENKGSDYTVRQLLDDYAAGLDGQFKNQSEVEASVRQTIGRAYYRLDVFDKAQAQLERALILRRRLFGEDEQVAATLADCAWASHGQSQLAKAESEARAALDIYRKNGTVGQPVIFALWILQLTLSGEQRYADVEAVTEQALAQARKTPNIEFPEIASIIHGLAQAKLQQAKYVEAENLFRQAMEMHRRLRGSQHPETGWALVGLATSLRQQHKLDEAERAAREALAIFKRQWSYGGNSVVAIGELKAALEAKGDFTGLVALCESILTEQRSTLGSYSPAVADTLTNLAGALQSLGKPTEAEKAAREALDISRNLTGPDLTPLPSIVGQLAQLLNARGRSNECEKLFEDNINTARQKLGETSPILAELFHTYAHFVAYCEYKPDQAAELYLKALPIRRSDTNDALQYTLRELGGVLLASGKPKEAEPYLREALTFYSELHQNEEIWGSAWPAANLADALSQQGRLAEAEQAYRKALFSYSKTEGIGGDGYTRVMESLLQTLKSEHKLAEAESFLKDLLAQDEQSIGRTNLTSVSMLLDLGDLLKLENRPDEAANRVHEATEIISNSRAEEILKLPTAAVSKMIHAATQAQARDICNKVLPAPATNAIWVNDLSWALVTGEDPTPLDAALAVELAQKVVAMNNRKEPNFLDTLAAADAEFGEFTNAVRVEQEAIGLLQNEEQKKDFASRLKLYESNTRYRDDGQLADRTMSLLADGKFAEAEPVARECMTLREKMIPDDWRMFNARSMLGSCLLGLKKYDEAEPLLVSGYEGMKQREAKIPPSGKVRLQHALRWLVQLCQETNRPDQTETWKTKLAELSDDVK